MTSTSSQPVLQTHHSLNLRGNSSKAAATTTFSRSITKHPLSVRHGKTSIHTLTSAHTPFNLTVLKNMASGRCAITPVLKGYFKQLVVNKTGLSGIISTLWTSAVLSEGWISSPKHTSCIQWASFTNVLWFFSLVSSEKLIKRKKTHLIHRPWFVLKRVNIFEWVSLFSLWISIVIKFG